MPFYKELGNQGLKATDVPVVAFSVGEEELRGIDTKPLVGHLAAWNYFMSVKNPNNTKFMKEWAEYVKAQNLPGGDKRVTNDPMEATFVGIHMWKQAVEKAKCTDADKVRRRRWSARRSRRRRASRLTMDGTTICTSRCSSARFAGDGQFNVVWKTKTAISAQPWSPYIAGNKGKPDDRQLRFRRSCGAHASRWALALASAGARVVDAPRPVLARQPRAASAAAPSLI